APLPALHSFPTRRSSDLGKIRNALEVSRGSVALVEDENAPALHAGIDLRRLTLDINVAIDRNALRDRCWINDRAILRHDELGLRSEEHTSELQSLAYLVC